MTRCHHTFSQHPPPQVSPWGFVGPGLLWGTSTRSHALTSWQGGVGQLPGQLSGWASLGRPCKCHHSCLLPHQQHPGQDGGHHSHHGDEGDEQEGPGAAAE